MGRAWGFELCDSIERSGESSIATSIQKINKLIKNLNLIDSVSHGCKLYVKTIEGKLYVQIRLLTSVILGMLISLLYY